MNLIISILKRVTAYHKLYEDRNKPENSNVNTYVSGVATIHFAAESVKLFPHIRF